MKIREGFVIREVMGSFVAVAVGEASLSFRGMVQLNPTAADIWRAIEEGLSESEICDRLEEKYEVERPRLEADVRKTIEDLVSQGFAEL